MNIGRHLVKRNVLVLQPPNLLPIIAALISAQQSPSPVISSQNDAALITALMAAKQQQEPSPVISSQNDAALITALMAAQQKNDPSGQNNDDSILAFILAAMAKPPEEEEEEKKKEEIEEEFGRQIDCLGESENRDKIGCVKTQNK
jgi:hypothetical protein